MIHAIIALVALLLAIALFVVAVWRGLRKHRRSGSWQDNAEGGPDRESWGHHGHISGEHHGGGFDGGGGDSAGGGAGGDFGCGGDGGGHS